MKNVSNSAIILLLGTLLTRTAMFMSIPFLAIYLDNVVKLSSTQIGYVIGIQPFVGVIFSLFVGKIIDYCQIKKVLIIVPIIWGIVFILFAYTNFFIGFLILNGLSGLSYVIYEPACKKALSQYAVTQSKLFIFNLRYAAINVGAVIGPLLSVFLGFKYTIKPYIILGFIYILVGLMNLFLRKSTVITNGKQNDLLFHYEKKYFNQKKNFFRLILLIVGVSFSYFGYSLFNSTISQYLSRLGENGVETYSSLLSLSALAIIIFQFPIIHLTRTIQSNCILAVSNLLFSSCLFIVNLFPNYLALITFTLFYSFGELLLGSRLDYTVDQLANENNKALFFSLAELTKIGSTMGPIIGGVLVSYLGWNNHIIIFCMLGIITLLGSPLLYFSRQKKAESVHPSFYDST
ncbi:MFS transporter [Tetragenococcus halophilus]|nr:MFS transporter [Tetragenococcus halophilus]MCO7027042.1 MFS transporter [Tetragenococcus halophilus]QXN86247.1 MFS transporter [Tetragenococcus halophilus]GBD60828.1 putative major facilitator superfamily transporter [Tetragenococcus halophilus subsp. halophilus]GBD70552.1 putative major facilitator superfamily transporter [Tetragenococcus halophilus subsp. halophilus]GFK23821.1 major facilitator superfamily transporter [Tetragenococcus halophilus]